MRNAINIVLASTSLLVPAHSAHAQDASASKDRNEPSGQLEEIIVTAQRRDESLQRVPLAVTALTPVAIANTGVISFADLNKAVPSFQTGIQGFSALGFLRGVGSTAANIGMEPPVAMFVDDVYIPSGTGSMFDFNSISGIEVLKGPQGTLFGRNATGGVVHVKTRNPTDETKVDAEVGYDNFQTVTAKFYGNAALSENVAANIAGYYTDQAKGWGHNIINGADSFKSKGYGIRGKVAINAAPGLDFLLSGLYSNRRTNQGLALRSAPGMSTFGGYNPDAQGADFWDITSDYSNPVRTSTSLGSLKTTYDFGSARLVSITAYQSVKLFAPIDGDTTPLPLVNVDADESGKTFTQEIQLLSPDDSAVSWILGGFYMWDKSKYQVTLSGGAVPGAPQFAKSFQTTNSYSGFAQATFNLFPETRMTLGLRYTEDHRAIDGYANSATATFGPFTDKASFKSVTGRITIDHQFSQDVMGYVGYNRGFKSGLFNIGAIGVGSTAAPAPVNPEELDAYTIGLKSDLLGRRLRFNAEAYLYKYRNMQTQNINPNGTTDLRNGGSATIKGLEAELTFVVDSHLTLNANLGLAEGKYDVFNNGLQFFPLAPNAPIAIPVGCAATVPTYPGAAGPLPMAQRSCDNSGNKTIQTPPLSTMLSASYKMPTEIGDFTLNASWTHGGNFFWEAGNAPYSKQPKTDLIAANVSWTSSNGLVGIRVYGRNLTNEKYYGYAGASALAGFKYSPAEPRTYGVALSVHY